MWWAIVTITTTGYGDVVPVSLWGRFLGGWVMVGGVVMFALWAGIIATRQELIDLIEAEARRRSTENAKAAASTIPINADEGGFHETRQ